MGDLRVLYIFHGIMYPVSIKMFPTEQHRLMEEVIYLTYIAHSISPRNMPMVRSLVCLLWFGTRQDHPYPSGLRHRHRNNHTIAPVPMKFWRIWVNTGENLDAVTAVTDSFKMADVFAGDRTGGAVAQTSSQTISVSVWQGRMWVNRLRGMHGSSWLVVVRAKSAIVDPRDAAVTARGWCRISFVKPNNDPVTTKSPTQRQYHTL